MMRLFSKFACIDWSGAKGERLKGLAIATIGQHGAPSLVTRAQHWSRPDVRDWLLDIASDQTDMLIGFDLSMALPFVDSQAYFPKWSDSPDNARQLWAFVERLSTETPYLGIDHFLKHPEAARHFRHSKYHVGDLFTGGTGRLRVVEHHQRKTGQANSASCFNLVGAAQVGKSSLTGMRMLHQLDRAVPIWPFDPIPETGPMIVEIYTTIAALAAGLPKGKSKIRDRKGLENALTALDTQTPPALNSYDDHSTDALITAAWMKQASLNEALWRPPILSDEIAQKEGWTFGVF